MAANPMTQFEVYRIGPEIKIGNFDISFTNASLFMVISSLAILIIFNLGSKKNSILPNKIQLLGELSYSFVSKMINDTAGSKAKPYFSFIFSLFMFVLFCNMFGMIPYTFTVTSHIIVTFVLAAFIFIGVTIIGFIKHAKEDYEGSKEEIISGELAALGTDFIKCLYVIGIFLNSRKDTSAGQFKKFIKNLHLREEPSKEIDLSLLSERGLKIFDLVHELEQENAYKEYLRFEPRLKDLFMATKAATDKKFQMIIDKKVKEI